MLTLLEAVERARDIWGPEATVTAWPTTRDTDRDDYWITVGRDPEMHRLDPEGRVTCNHDRCWFMEADADHSGEHWGV